MKKLCFLIMMFFVLAACSTGQQEEVHYIAKSEHWKAVYDSNAEDGLRIFYLGENKDLGDLQISIEGAKNSLGLSDVRVNTEGQLTLTKKESEQIFKEDTSPIIHIQWQSYDETLEVQNNRRVD
ncbi:hypothetical protein [Bacillus sp. RS11]|uniref:hypothetical protein n=1 Tax=Lysinibacillus sp. RS11 TaxID=3242682 RepID=UPI0035C755C4